MGDFVLADIRVLSLDSDLGRGWLERAGQRNCSMCFDGGVGGAGRGLDWFLAPVTVPAHHSRLPTQRRTACWATEILDAAGGPFFEGEEAD